MGSDEIAFEPLADSDFGVIVTTQASSCSQLISTLLYHSSTLRSALNDAGGLMVVKDLNALEQAPEKLVLLSGIFGPEIENYYATPTAKRFLHDSTPEILVLSNLPPCEHPPPPRPDPAYTKNGGLVVSYPHQTNWHTDQSYRRPPPDVTLLFGITTPPSDQGQTIFANCTAAYAALSPDLQQKIKGLNGIHAAGWIGRSEEDVLNVVTPKDVMPHQQPQLQPLVRNHPDTGKPALYLSEEKQMDFVDGPISGLSKGPNGEGAKMLRYLLAHSTQPKFTYAHHWQPGDLVISDNRCLMHTATWYDANKHARLMWRTTVMGNAGNEYAGEEKSWIPKNGIAVDHGMENT